MSLSFTRYARNAVIQHGDDLLASSPQGDSSAPSICLRTRKSLRAVHFHPHGAPLVLTAEVNNPEQNDYPPSLAMALGVAGQVMCLGALLY